MENKDNNIEVEKMENVEAQKKKKMIIIAIVIVAVIVAVVVAVAVKVANKPEPAPQISQEVSEALPEIQGEIKMPLIPVDFETLQAQYPDVYCWLSIPGTTIDYAVVQAPEGEGDDYYLRKNLDKEKETGGTLYSQASLNKKDLSDKVTIIYGHHMRNETMFGTLDLYETSEHRDAHKTMVLYQPGKIYTYELAFAVTYSDAHILYTYDCNNDEAGYQEFLDSLNTGQYAPSWMNEDIKLTTEDQILILSTCNDVDTQRYLVGAKLVSVQDGEYRADEAEALKNVEQ